LNALDEAYAEAGSKYHALLGVQIPNSVLGKACRERVVEFFKEKGVTVENGGLVEYFNERKTEDIANLNKVDSPARVLIYKQAITMGWDCPRAQVLVGFRHIKSRSFTTQNLGRFPANHGSTPLHC
jgi:type III restriction enzyme